MSQRWGKKFRVERFQVEGSWVEYEIRVDEDEGTFRIEVGQRRFHGRDLPLIRKEARAELERTHRQVFDPFIRVHYYTDEDLEHHHHGNWPDGVEQVEFAFGLVWRSQGKSSSVNRWRHHMNVSEAAYAVVDGKVEAEGGGYVPVPPNDRQKRDAAGDDGEGLTPFTPERWGRLLAIKEALGDLRRRIAEVLMDSTGKKLDALVGLDGGLLGAAMREPPRQLVSGGRRRG